MGKVCSKCVKKKKYKDKQAPHGGRQAEQNADSGKILTNKGKTIDPRDVGDEEGTDGKHQPEEKPRPKKQESSSRRKSKQRKTSSEESSDSSSSSSDQGYKKHTTKVHKNSRGGTTIVSKTVNVSGPYTKIQNVDNVVLTINAAPVKKRSRPKRPKETPASPSPSTGPCKEVFSNYHTAETIRERITTLTATDPITAPVGFSNPGLNDFEDAYTQLEVLKMSGSVCKVVYPDGFATGIRVGPNYLMIPLHVLYKLLGGYTDIARRRNSTNGMFSGLKRNTVFASFYYDNQKDDPVKFYFEEEVHFMDKITDIAVVKLKSNQDGHHMPPPFKYFSIPNSSFIFIGHPHGLVKKTEVVKKTVLLNDVTKNEIIDLRRWSLENFLRPYDYAEHVDSFHRLLFKSNMANGASGSPGLVLIDGKHVGVVTIFLHKYPDMLYDSDVPQSDKDKVPDNYCISQGANMYSVYLEMKKRDRSLCDEIFHSWQDQ